MQHYKYMGGRLLRTGNGWVTRAVVWTAVGGLAPTMSGGDASRLTLESAALTLQQITSGMEQADRQRVEDLDAYTVTRNYVLHNSRMQSDASMVVRITYRKGQGKTFQVVEENGADGMGKRVFQHLIDAEIDGSHPDHQERARVNTRNYDFELEGMAVENGRRCYVLALHPKAKTKYLFNGKVWVDAEDLTMMKLEGHPAANVSFWVGKPNVVQTWQKVGGFWVAASNRTHAESHLLGTTELTVENSDYDVRPASNERLALHQKSAIGTIN